jgi:hypothetical protein
VNERLSLPIGFDYSAVLTAHKCQAKPLKP